MAILLKTVTAGKRWQFAQFGYQLIGFAEGERPIVVNTRDDDSLVCYDAGIKRPYSAPVVAAGAGGNLTAGEYDVAWAYYRSIDNCYSALSPSVAITAALTVNAVTFTGSGLDDATSGGTYTGSALATFTVIIDGSAPSPDTFKWKKDSGSFTTGVSASAGAHTLSDGVTITFAAIDGHTIDDQWVFTAGGSAIVVNALHAPENKAWPLTDTIDQMRIFISPPNFGQFYWPNTADTTIDIKTNRKSDVATETVLPGFGETDGAIRRAAGDNRLYKGTHDTDNAGTVRAVSFSGSGLNDATSTVTAPGYNGTVPATYTVVVDATGTPDTFKWNRDGGAFTTGVAMTGAAQLLDLRTNVTFAATTGHTVGDAWTIVAGITWALLGVTYDQTDTNLVAGLQADLFEWDILPGLRKMVTVGDRLIGGGQATREGAGTCTVTNDTFAGKTRAKVVLTSDTINDGMMWRKFVVNGTVIGRVFYTDADPFDQTTFYLKDPWRGATITAEDNYRWEGDQFIWATANINLAVGQTIVQTTFPQSFNPESYLGPELEIGDQDEIRDIVPVGNSVIVGMDTKFIRIDTALTAGSFRDAGVAGIVVLEKNLGTISYFSGAKAVNNTVSFLASDGIVSGSENNLELLTDPLANRTYFRDKLSRATFANARGVFVKSDQRDYYILYYLKDTADADFTHCVLLDLQEGKIVPYDIGAKFTEVLQISDSNGAPTALYGDTTGNIGFFLKPSTFTFNGAAYTTYWQSGALDFGSPQKKSLVGIITTQLFKDTSYSLTLNVYGLGNNFDLDSLPTPSARTITQADEGYRMNIPVTRWSELFMLRLTATAANWPKYVSRIEFDVKPAETVR